MKRHEFSLSGALNTYILPISVTTSQTCLLSENIVFEAGFEFTVLQRKNVRLLFGTDWHGKTFRLNTEMLNDLYVDIVDEFYPKNLKEIQEIIPNISYILCKTTKSIEYFRISKLETFSDLEKIVLITCGGQTIYQSLDSLLNKDRFVFVHCKKTTSFIELLSNNIENGTVIRFNNCFDRQIPTGTVVINGVYAHDSILIVSKLLGNHNKLLYQIFLLDSGIKVFISEKPLPLEVVDFGNFDSTTYISRIKAIMFSVSYDIYSPLFYGQLIVDISFRNEAKKDEEDTKRGANNNNEEDTEIRAKNISNLNGLEEKVENNVQNVSRPTSLFSSLTANNCLTKQSINSSFYKIEEISPFENIFELSDSKSNTKKYKYKLREQAIQQKNSNDDSGIDSPDANEVFEQLLADFTCNDKSFEQQCHNLNKYENDLTKSKSDEIKEYLKIKHSKSDTSLSDTSSDENVNTSKLLEASYTTYNVYCSVDYSSVKPRQFSSLSQKKEIESLEEIKACSIKDIEKRLQKLQLSKFVNKFRQQMINGRLLVNLTESALIEMGFSHFEARKLHNYVHGWRVNIQNCCENLEDAPVTNWSVYDVKKSMKKIKLDRLGAFAIKNQVDGNLLEDLIRNNYIKTLKKDYGIKLSIVETERLRGYVYKQLNYKD
ncbi:uncharacterized protein LOC105845947 [Hydra vulgaris]|uniref:uncharacterized protein LOC105845947 n=1 Tax=Hydra vulgaris TaxID=6087 RepID=UPI001F5F6FE0|nr:uncharacterized protein LOC105845947 [Hydra vulgaris]